ncbi:putative adhesin [Xenorhabdus siamensis]|uniref:putative adhesin n=1 Tax=Xenorhabdus siamensis TaxID=3136254 RepID=UPI0030F3A8B5
MSTLLYKNIAIDRDGLLTMKALVFTHGGYTPAFLCDMCCFGGSGYTIVPNGITLWFNSKHDTASVGLSSARNLLLGKFSNYKASDKVRYGERVRNYSLTPNNKLSTPPNWQFDIITINF